MQKRIFHYIIQILALIVMEAARMIMGKNASVVMEQEKLVKSAMGEE